MPHADLFAPMSFSRGPAMKNRFMLAPLTNCQSHDDGTLSNEERHWLTMRAEGGFGSTMTCAAHVQASGQGFPGQLGIFSDAHIEPLRPLAAAIKAQDSVAIVQLHHAGMRSPADLIGETPHCPSDNEQFKARALTEAEVEQLRDDFIAGAVRAEQAGFDGVELHGAHGYILAQFLSGEVNQRTDKWGGALENRERLVREIIKGIRARCRPDFNLGIRLSGERFGIQISEALSFAQDLMRGGQLDYIDMSLWDIFKEPEDAAYKGRSLTDWFAGLDRGSTRLGVAGQVRTAESATAALAAGVDFVLVGRAAILHHDFPEKVRRDPAFQPAPLPVTPEYLRKEGLSDKFLDYMKSFKGFMAVSEPA